MDNQPQYRPLYSQVYETLVKRIADGVWRPGQVLPSEQALALQLGVSQGTVRKALDALAVDKIIDRRQGKGHEQEQAEQDPPAHRAEQRLPQEEGQADDHEETHDQSGRGRDPDVHGRALDSVGDVRELRLCELDVGADHPLSGGLGRLDLVDQTGRLRLSGRGPAGLDVGRARRIAWFVQGGLPSMSWGTRP